ncbi:Aspartic peptidase domain [Plasmopara halstedii]|uniref:Aspartic peptidase domain n=1 Tax=Plasmopara halstedii TaxID=4781 RepID=A0A0N7L386_PLAHL|nr:Aspartic peptidase domain [Plasmopara halstedii]CEG35179.1 Aspartic peptidase domain [Plasmopara halstedii]|eukprot:XP_024571548.1 Aspartic peptidase domain [Plasmopara halstedii]
MSPTREEVQYRRCKTVSQAMKIALEYDRSHHVRRKNVSPPVFLQDRSRPHTNGNQQQQSAHAHPQENKPEPMEIESGTVKVSTSNSVAPASDEERVVEVEENLTSTLPTMHRENELIRRQGTCEGKPAAIMLDSGATCNVVRPGLANNMSTSGVSQVTRFDGTSSRGRSVKKGTATIGFSRYRFQVIKWPLRSAHDVILGKPWSTKFQTNIDWRSHEIFFPSMRNPPTPPVISQEALEIAAIDFKRKIKKKAYDEV